MATDANFYKFYPIVENLVATWSADYKRMTAPVIESIYKRLMLGDGPEDAVRKAFTASNLDAKLANSLLDAMGVAAAEAVGPGVTVKPSGIDKLLTLPWTADQMPLSQRLHGASGTMRQKIVDEVQGALNRGADWKATARQLYDGYGFPTTIQSAELPQYLSDLLKVSRQIDNGPELRRLLRTANRQIRLLGQDGAPNQALKAAYKGIVKAVATGTDKAVERAVRVGVEEKSRYYAERIARTEMARAWAEGFWAQYGGDDLVAAVRWRLSSRHPRFDICDFHAHANLYGLGQGIYPKDRAPALPAHPHCTCHLTPVFFNEVGTPDPDRMKQRGDAYLESLDEADRKKLLTIGGEDAWQNGRDWQSELRNWKGHQNFAGRLTKEDFTIPAAPAVPSQIGMKTFYTDGKKQTTREAMRIEHDGIEITWPKDMKPRYQPMTYEDVIAAVKALPADLRATVKEIQLLDYRNPYDRFWEKKYGIKNFYSTAVGGGGRVVIFANQKAVQTKTAAEWNLFKDYAREVAAESLKTHTLPHEAGHNWDQLLGKKIGADRVSTTAVWSDIMKADKAINGKDGCSWYAVASKAPVEDFAEAVQLYLKDQASFKTDFPNRYEFMKKELGP